MSTDERHLLGAMMRSREAVAVATESLDAGDLADYRLHSLWHAIVALEGKGVTDQPQAVVQAMDGGDLERLGGTDTVVGLWMDAPPTSSTAYYAKRVATQAARRRLSEAATSIQEMATKADEEVEPQALVEAAYQALDEARPSREPDTGLLGDSLDEVIDRLDSTPQFWPTPWGSLNGHIDGFRPGALYVVGARPGSGKSIMGLQSAAHLAKWGNVAFCSLEMSRAELVERLVAQRAGVHMTAMSRHTLTPTDWERVAKVQSEVRTLPLYVDDRSGVSLAQVRSHVRAVARRGPLSGVVVDYLQLLRASDPRRPRWEQVSEFSHGLKVLAREFDVPVLALAQLNRESEGNRRLPNMSDLRESGSIEQDADVVMLMQRGYDEQSGMHTDDLDVVVAKNRRGLTGRVTLLWEAQFARLLEGQWSK